MFRGMGKLPKSVITGLYGSSLLKVLWNIHTASHQRWTRRHFHLQRVGFLTLHPTNTSYFQSFKYMPFLLVWNNMWRWALFLYFIIIHQSLRKCWFISSPHFWMRLLDFVYVVKSFWVAYNIYYLSLICCIVGKYFLLFRRVIKILILA